MKTEEITIANLKCNGCASTIKNELGKIEGVNNVEIDLEMDLVQIASNDDAKRSAFVEKLLSLGYPEATEKNGLLLQLKSYTSCMVGKVNNMSQTNN